MKHTFYKYVQKSKILPDSIDILTNTSEGQQLLELLNNAIVNNDFQHNVFSNPHCVVMIQCLFEQGKITHEQRVNLFLFISALQTFTDKQPVAENIPFAYNRQKFHATVAVVRINSDHIVGMLENFKRLAYGVPYYERSYFKKLIENTNLDVNEIIEAVKLLPSSEQNLIVISRGDVTRNNSLFEAAGRGLSDGMVGSYMRRRVASEKDKSQHDVLVLPSYGLMKFFVKRLKPDHPIFELEPVLGSITFSTKMRDFGSAKKVPLSVHCPYILSNPKAVHGTVNDPCSILCHDLLHFSYTNLLVPIDDLNFLSQLFNPFVSKIVSHCKTKRDTNDKWSKNWENNIEQLSDLSTGNNSIFRLIGMDSLQFQFETDNTDPYRHIVRAALILEIYSSGYNSTFKSAAGSLLQQISKVPECQPMIALLKHLLQEPFPGLSKIDDAWIEKAYQYVVSNPGLTNIPTQDFAYEVDPDFDPVLYLSTLAPARAVCVDYKRTIEAANNAGDDDDNDAEVHQGKKAKVK